MSIALEQRAEGVVLPVRAQPGARKNGLKGIHGGSLKVCVTQVAEKGKANAALEDVLCKVLALRRSQLALIAGETAAQKRFLVTGISLEELRERITRAVES